MTPFTALWLPILLSAVAVFVASSVIHMVSPWHRSDYAPLPDQDRVLDAMRPLHIPPGDYFLPRPASRSEMRSPEFLEKVRRGPVVIMTVAHNEPFSMGRNMSLWFVYLVLVEALAAFVACRAVPPAGGRGRVGGFTGLVSFAGLSLALWQMSIWYARSWKTTLKSTIDGLIYAFLTAWIFAWLWPH